ncbi:hypothetical protein Tdes44962_MAKER08498 [Teratosphaeria destructans]|uniref:Uncharacterized protein n=1 Tax=Teratosphaeria destructans TaxID=418781 RepID=A0A9W7SW01_9PEZI|nr:hypothetical protein Tdes44962_MAKER08498 [Teratosphaeria destructans]
MDDDYHHRRFRKHHVREDEDLPWISYVENRLARTESEAGKLRDENKELKREAGQLRDENLELRREAGQLRDRNKELESSASVRKGYIMALNEEIDVLKEGRRGTELDGKKLQQQVDEETELDVESLQEHAEAESAPSVLELQNQSETETAPTVSRMSKSPHGSWKATALIAALLVCALFLGRFTSSPQLRQHQHQHQQPQVPDIPVSRHAPVTGISGRDATRRTTRAALVVLRGRIWREARGGDWVNLEGAGVCVVWRAER